MSDQDKTRQAEALQLPAGSFELSDLEKIGEAAAKVADDKRDTLVADRLAKANKRPDAQAVPGQLPGHRLEEVDRVLVEGVEQPVAGGKRGEKEIVGEVTVTESVQVFDPKLAAEEQEAAEAAPAEGTAAPAPAPAPAD